MSNNNDKHPDPYIIAQRLLKWLKGEKAPPFLVNMYFTKKCNLGCKFCYYSGIDKKIDYSNELNIEEWLRVIEDGIKFGIHSWYLGGGEPFFCQDKILPMMELIKKYGKHGNVNTNGTLLNEENVKKMINISWDEINITLNSIDSKIDDSIRGRPGTFKKCIKGIKLIKKTKTKIRKNEQTYYKKIKNLGMNLILSDVNNIRMMKPTVNIHTVITNKNYNQISKMVKLAYKLKALSINFTHVMEDTQYARTLKLTQEQIKIFKKEAQKAFILIKKFGLYTNLQDYISTPINENLGKYYDLLKTTSLKKNKYNLLSSICFEPWSEMSIFADGIVGACGQWNPAITQENVKNKSIKEIWYGKFFENIRKRMTKQGQLDECEDCASSRILRNEDVKIYLKKFLDSSEI